MAILERLQFDPDEDFARLREEFRAGRLPIVRSPMAEHFRQAREKTRSFLNHGPVLAVSIGGSNTKVMLASMDNGRLCVHRLTACRNPEIPRSFQDVFDEILLGDPRIRDYLKKSDCPCIGFSIPVPMPRPDVFAHISKVPGITGLIARDLERDAPTHHFGEKIARYFRERGVDSPTLFYYSDTVVAHHGAMSSFPLQPGDKTILLVCGTGMATCDEESFVLTCYAPLLDTDEELYPRADTEGYQYQFCSAGKGLFRLMERAIRIRAQEGDSGLGAHDLRPYFRTTHDSRTVVEIWESSLPGHKAAGRAGDLLAAIGGAAFAELQQLATPIVERAISAIANSGVATALHMGPTSGDRGHIVFFEGSIAKNQEMLPLIKAEIARLAQKLNLRDFVLDPVLHQPVAVGDADLRELDLSLVGAATCVIATRQ